MRVSFQPGQSREDFGKFSLSFADKDGLVHTTGLKFDFYDLFGFTRDMASVPFDFLIIAMLVYNVDRAVSRAEYSVEGWRRYLKVEGIPVLNLSAVNQGKVPLERAINFLTGDNWDLNFVQAQGYNYNPQNLQEWNCMEYSKVALFSGGLDSLIGFIDETYSLLDDEKILLISHMELGKERADQQTILEYCRTNNIFDGKYARLLINAGLQPRGWNVSTKAESTFRSRSLLFFAAGIYAANSISPNMNLIVPENGTISINIPLDSGRRSSCSTRTTHPVFIRRLKRALGEMGVNSRLINPYCLKSKADMVIDCCGDSSKKQIFNQLYDLSCSCAKRGHNSYWDKDSQYIRDNKVKHCGMCLPCLYRRVALDAVNLDSPDRLGTDVFNGCRFDIHRLSQKSSRDFRALLAFLQNRMTSAYIEEELMLNGITDTQELARYVEFAVHSYNQVKDWIRKNANSTIRKMAGV